MEDYMYQAEKARAVGANVLLVIALIFLIGGMIFQEGFMSTPVIRYSIVAVGVMILIAGIAVRFTKPKEPSTYV